MKKEIDIYNTEDEKEDDEIIVNYEGEKKYEIFNELTNGNLVSGNSYGIKTYKRVNNKYELISKSNNKLEIRNIIEIKLYLIVILNMNSK